MRVNQSRLSFFTYTSLTRQLQAELSCRLPTTGSQDGISTFFGRLTALAKLPQQGHLFQFLAISDHLKVNLTIHIFADCFGGQEMSKILSKICPIYGKTAKIQGFATVWAKISFQSLDLVVFGLVVVVVMRLLLLHSVL